MERHMGNDDKVKELTLFLGDELERIHHSSTGQAYDIEKEYAKTKKN